MSLCYMASRPGARPLSFVFHFSASLSRHHLASSLYAENEAKQRAGEKERRSEGCPTMRWTRGLSASGQVSGCSLAFLLSLSLLATCVPFLYSLFLLVLRPFLFEPSVGRFPPPLLLALLRRERARSGEDARQTPESISSRPLGGNKCSVTPSARFQCTEIRTSPETTGGP